MDLKRVEDYFVGRFSAMASPCEVLVDTDSPPRARRALEVAAEEARRIERKYSRYLADSELSRINGSQGLPISVDEETAHLLDYAATCYEMSEGMFDVTSGVLRRAWKFDGSDRVPTEAAVAELLQHVGWTRVGWANRTLTLPAGMEIDLGGIGKEYAVDRAAALIAEEIPDAFVVNFGGDLYASGARRGGRPWGIGVDDPEQTGKAATQRIDVTMGGLATSGDARRYLLCRGKRLGHILNPKTGWPIDGAPRSVTVIASTCVEAGTLSTLAYLQGPGAKAFLESEGVPFRIN
ncbi:MAG: FAD:protein FMN transferase [Vicinamibacteria bacterium]